MAEQLKIDPKTRKKILKQYLGRFFVPFSEGTWEKMEKAFPKRTSTYVVGKRKFLLEVGCYFLLKWGRQIFRDHYSHELVDAYLGKKTLDEAAEEGTFYDDALPFMIIYHMLGTMPNKQMEPMIIHNVSQRSLEHRITLVLCESRLVTVRNCFSQLGLPVVDSEGSGGSVEI